MKIKLILICLLVPVLGMSQSKDKKGQWYIQGNVGYAFSLTDEDVSSVEIVNDSVTSSETKTVSDRESEGLTINVEALYKKKSGWHYSLGLHSFFGKPMEYIYASRNDYPYWANRIPNYNKQQTSLTFKGGIGFETTYKKRANIYTRLHLLIGGGWYTYRKGYNVDFQDFVEFKWDYSDTFLRTWGASLSLGADLKLDRNWSVIVNSEVYLVRMGLPDIEGVMGQGSYSNPSNTETVLWAESNNYSSYNGGYLNISLGLGLRYKL